MNTRRKNSSTWQWILIVAAFIGATFNAKAAGLLSPSDGSLPPLKIKQHHVEVIIEDGYAITQVEQEFYNPHNLDLEAVYSFPVPEKGAVSEFTMWIDGKPVSGEVLEKKEARTIYEEEKAAGREAGITEKDSYKTFDISISPVRAGQSTRIRLVYMQPVHIDSAMGRYVYPLEEGGVDEQKLAFWSRNEVVDEHFSFNLKMRSAHPIDALRVPNQSAQIQQSGSGEWTVSLGTNNNTVKEEGVKPMPNTGPAFTLDKDMVVYWRLQDGLPGSVDLVTYKPEADKRGTFMLVLTPADDLKPIREGKDWVFVLDMSGSMKGKYATLADGVQRALDKMRPDDRFRIVLFNNSSYELTNGYVNATAEAVQRYSQEVAAVQPTNGTNLYAGLVKGIRSLDADRTSAIVLVTDGVANVGETAQRKFIELVERKDVRLFTFIMGNSANRPLLDGLTRASHGFSASISNSDDIVGQLLTATSKVTHEALHGVELDIDGIKVADLTPSQIGSLYRGQQLIVMGHYWGDGEADVTLKGKISGKKKSYSTRFAFPSKTSSNPELERLWAYASIEQLQQQMEDFGEDADTRRAATDLALEYSLVTDDTSMVVLREEIYTQRGIERKNQKRLVVEKQAQQQRAAQQVQPRRVDQSKPMFTGKRSSTGGGAIDGWSLVLLMGLLAAVISSRNNGNRIDA